MLVYGLPNRNFCCIQIFLRMATVVFFSRKPFIVSLQRMSPVVSQYLAHVACFALSNKVVFVYIVHTKSCQRLWLPWSLLSFCFFFGHVNDRLLQRVQRAATRLIIYVNDRPQGETYDIHVCVCVFIIVYIFLIYYLFRSR